MNSAKAKELWTKIGAYNRLFSERPIDHDLYGFIRWRTAEALAFKAANTAGLTDEQRQTLCDMASHEFNCAIALTERLENRTL
jgi:hypothetical protein